MVRDHLRCSTNTHNRQMKNLATEATLRAHETKYPGLLDFKNLYVKSIKMVRISQRVLLVAVCKVDDTIKKTRVVGEKVGLKYPEEAPKRKMMGPKLVQDHLALESEECFPLPSLDDVDL